mmetsp:Transcript_4613/g.10187  ORF Transcript_4613/g.10187 Transcript_4613/m.10187 type:complete len:235 (-) Transcript_4613:1780-2484(-)
MVDSSAPLSPPLAGRGVLFLEGESIEAGVLSLKLSSRGGEVGVAGVGIETEGMETGETGGGDRDAARSAASAAFSASARTCSPKASSASAASAASARFRSAAIILRAMGWYVSWCSSKVSMASWRALEDALSRRYRGLANFIRPCEVMKATTCGVIQSASESRQSDCHRSMISALWEAEKLYVASRHSKKGTGKTSSGERGELLECCSSCSRNTFFCWADHTEMSHEVLAGAVV